MSGHPKYIQLIEEGYCSLEKIYAQKLIDRMRTVTDVLVDQMTEDEVHQQRSTGSMISVMKHEGLVDLIQFIRFLKPIIEILRESGGSGTSSEVTDKVIERLNIPDDEQSVILKSGQSRVYHQVHWARMYLVYGGILDSSKRGVWTLTEEGNNTKLEQFDSLKFFKTVHKPALSEKRLL